MDELPISNGLASESDQNILRSISILVVSNLLIYYAVRLSYYASIQRRRSNRREGEAIGEKGKQ